MPSALKLVSFVELAAISITVGALVCAQSQVPFSPDWQFHEPVFFSVDTLVGAFFVVCTVVGWLARRTRGTDGVVDFLAGVSAMIVLSSKVSLVCSFLAAVSTGLVEAEQSHVWPSFAN